MKEREKMPGTLMLPPTFFSKPVRFYPLLLFFFLGPKACVMKKSVMKKNFVCAKKCVSGLQEKGS